ncbi:MAG: Bro-N domain-containing protein, partial [Fibromonadales bacterium]|nr:Bro-N domain-containing protein [Fibromonadales bacterium]
MANKIKSILDTEPPEESQYDGWTYFGDAGNKKEKVPYILKRVSEGVSEAWYPMGECWASFMNMPSPALLNMWILDAIKDKLIKKGDVKDCELDSGKFALNFKSILKLLEDYPLHINQNLKRHFLSQVETIKGEVMKKGKNSIGKFDPKMATELVRKPMPIGDDISDTANKFSLAEARKKIAEAAKTKAVGFCGVDKGADEHAVTKVASSMQTSSKPLSLLDYFFSEKDVRVYSPSDNEFWFCAVDVCKFLGYGDVEKTLKAHCLGKSMRHRPEKSTKDLIYISEGDLNNLILRSSSPKEEVRVFRQLITEKVIPAIRQYRKFIMLQEETESIAQKATKLLPSGIGEQ